MAPPPAPSSGLFGPPEGYSIPASLTVTQYSELIKKGWTPLRISLTFHLPASQRQPIVDQPNVFRDATPSSSTLHPSDSASNQPTSHFERKLRAADGASEVSHVGQKKSIVLTTTEPLSSSPIQVPSSPLASRTPEPGSVTKKESQQGDENTGNHTGTDAGMDITSQRVESPFSGSNWSEGYNLKAKQDAHSCKSNAHVDPTTEEDEEVDMHIYEEDAEDMTADLLELGIEAAQHAAENKATKARKSKSKSTSKPKDKGKGKEKMTDENEPARGPLTAEELGKVNELGETIRALAREMGRTPEALLKLANVIVTLGRDRNAWNVFRMWLKAQQHHPIGDLDDWNEAAQELYQEAIKDLSPEEKKDLVQKWVVDMETDEAYESVCNIVRTRLAIKQLQSLATSLCAMDDIELTCFVVSTSDDKGASQVSTVVTGSDRLRSLITNDDNKVMLGDLLAKYRTLVK
ncbi:hypothetical protein Hypma_002979 [Hypsizygus marmoreus]|uniref:Uncharacterized protein n=1 Tax=Hypsizygus marmoreus TaxID=39966 RepID=A0A369J7F9_HYPMA|nr:hypothetical protein Hypma_002979 [Hypsizygus marmoreus]